MAKAILRDGVYETLRARIITGQLTPGEALGEERLAAELNVSRTPLREALRKLSEEGFVEYKPFRGARVIQPTPELVREIFLIREALEGVAAREAALQVAASRLHALRQHLEELRPLVARGEVGDVGDAIHELLFSECRNNKLLQMMSVYLGLVRWFQHLATLVPGRLVQAFREHDSILSALEARDPEWAESVARAHVRNTLRDLLESLKQKTGAAV
jgi:DNA-binding GntR family transcriptional regulator